MQSSIFYTFTQQYFLKVKVIIHPQYQLFEKEIINLARNYHNQGKILVEGARNSIKIHELNQEEVTLKFFKKLGFFKAIIYTFFRESKAKRSFNYANYLIDHQIKTPFPIAYIEEKNSLGLLSNSYYISAYIPYDFTIRELIHDPFFKDRKTIIEQFTAFTYSMHEANVNFLDHSPGNTLIVKKENQQYDFYLIDLNRMKFEKMSWYKRMDNFKKMWLSKQMLKIVATTYAQLSHQPIESLQQILFQTSGDFKRKINKKKWLKRKMKHLKK